MNNMTPLFCKNTEGPLFSSSIVYLSFSRIKIEFLLEKFFEMVENWAKCRLLNLG